MVNTQKTLGSFITAILAVTFSLVVSSAVARADNEPVVIEIKEHRFIPTEVEIPANKKVQIKIKNLDSTPEEFESYDLNREKVVTANGEISIFVGPLQPGEYKFFGEFNQETAQGKIIVR